MMLNVNHKSHMSTIGAVEEEISIALPKGLKLGEYRILRAIGQGGFGITYLAEHVDTKKEYVIKENMPASFSRRDERSYKVTPTGAEMISTFEWALDRFLQEARTLSRLQHPNIVQVKAAFKALGTAYYVMERIKGRELHEAAPSPDQITEAWLRPVLEGILKALHYVHSQNLLHRDIKPSNILVDEFNHPVLIDFGTARELVSERTATMVESAGYTPLEQLQSKAKRGAWTDIYALGCTMYRVITGENPPRSIDRLSEDSCRKLAEDSSLLSRFSRGFLQSVDKALAVQARNRWQDTQEWLQGMNGNAFSVSEIEPLPLETPPSLPPVTAQGTLPPLSSGAYPQAPMPTPAANLKQRTFFKGRCGRGMWWLHLLICFCLSALTESMGDSVDDLIGVLLCVLYIYAMGRRFNDVGYSGWWVIPYVLMSGIVTAALAESSAGNAAFIVGFLALAVVPGCVPGQKGPNKYGV